MTNQVYPRWFNSVSLIALMAFFMGFLTACSPASYTTDGQSVNPNTDNVQNNNGNGGNTLPPGYNYYQLYSGVLQVNVKIKDVLVRTIDGRVISVPGSEGKILDLMKMETTDGVSVRLPSQETVVEVILRLKGDGNHQINFADGRVCKMRTNGEVTLFARNAIVLDANVPYKVHGSFDPLEALSLNCSNSGAHIFNAQSVHAMTGSHHHDDDCNDDDGGSENECKLKCALANSRFEISGVEFDDGAGDL